VMGYIGYDYSGYSWHRESLARIERMSIIIMVAVPGIYPEFMLVYLRQFGYRIR